jgi:hypothetical protein
MTMLDYPPDQYYSSSGRAPLIPTTLAAIMSWVAAGALGAVYAYADLYLKSSDKASALILIAFAVGGGFAVLGAMRLAKVNNRGIVIVIAVSSALLMFYASWVVWETALVRQTGRNATPWHLFQRPAAVWRFAQAINEEGTFTQNDKPIAGTELWIYWVGEALLLIGTVFAIPFALLKGRALCESCGKWCTQAKAVARVQPFDDDLVRDHMEQKDFEYLVRLGPASEVTPVHLRVDLQTCPKCDQTNLLTVNRVKVSYHNNARIENAKPVVDRLWLDAAQAAYIRSLSQRLTAVATPAPATPAPAAPDPAKDASNPES